MTSAAVALLLSVGATAATVQPRVVRLETDDGWTIAAAYAAPKKARPVAILVHGVAAGRGEYEAFASTLQARGWGTLALDLRGHGESTAGPSGRRTFEDFDRDGEWTKASLDVLAAAQFLEKQGVRQSRLVLIGGSIGANLCAQVFNALPRARRLVLLSPGVEYRGVKLPRVDGRRTIAAASPGDQFAYQTVGVMKKALPGLTVLVADAGHGAQMLAQPAFVRALLRRLDSKQAPEHRERSK